jgi:hypothetical protein
MSRRLIPGLFHIAQVFTFHTPAEISSFDHYTPRFFTLTNTAIVQTTVESAHPKNQPLAP